MLQSCSVQGDKQSINNKNSNSRSNKNSKQRSLNEDKKTVTTVTTRKQQEIYITGESCINIKTSSKEEK